MSNNRASQSTPLSRLVATPWAALSVWLARLKTALFGGYRPERHYMRGAGPKARALEESSKQA